MLPISHSGNDRWSIQVFDRRITGSLLGCGAPQKMTRVEEVISASDLIGGLGPGGLDSWDLLMKGIVT